MSRMQVESGIGQAIAGLDALAATDVLALEDARLTEELQQLVTVADRVQAQLVRRVEIFDRRGLAAADGFRGAKSWLQAACRVSGVVAHRLVKAGRLLRDLPKLAEAFQAGQVPAETVQQVVRLADQVGAERVVEIEPTLTDAAAQLDPAGFAVVAERVRAHLVPDGGADPAQRFARRAFTLSPVGDMVALHGQLDPEGGAALASALDAVMSPPGDGDERSAAQRRADALVELARRPLATGELPTLGGQRPQVGLLLYPQALSPETLARLAQMQQDSFSADRLRQFLHSPDTAGDAVDVSGRVFGRTAAAMRGDLPGSAENAAADRPTTDNNQTQAAEADGPETDSPETDSPETDAPEVQPAAAGSAGSAGSRSGEEQGRRSPPVWARPGWNDPPHLNWVGPVPVETAQRIACDADLFRLILDPASGMPLDVGRSHRLVPYWIRRALWARDRTCRWIGCTVPVQWTDSHHLDGWADGGETKVERLLSLCRHHHGLVHEGGWSLDLDPHTGEVHITRPGGLPYRVPKARSRSWNGPAT